MKDHLAIIEATSSTKESFPIVKWCSSHEEANAFLANWLKDNRSTRPDVRTTIAKSVFVIEG